VSAWHISPRDWSPSADSGTSSLRLRSWPEWWLRQKVVLFIRFPHHGTPLLMLMISPCTCSLTSHASHTSHKI
jgi:hypothetical protein